MHSTTADLLREQLRGIDLRKIGPRVKLEQQLSELAAIGITLDPGVTIDDLLDFDCREDYEAEPFDFLTFVIGGEVQRGALLGRPMCRRVWTVFEPCIEHDGDYVRIVDRLVSMTGAEDRVSEVRDRVDRDAGGVWVEYTLDGSKRRHWEATAKGRSIDPQVLWQVMGDLERDGDRFYTKEFDVAWVNFYVDEMAAVRLAQLSVQPLWRAYALWTEMVR
jgi:hypothetical protein